MKTTYVLVLAAATVTRLAAQQLTAAQVPPAVRQAWHARFPAAQRAEWKLKSDHAYEAEFTVHRVDIGYKVIESQRLERTADPRVLWEVHLENAREVVKAQFDGHGALFSKSVKAKQKSFSLLAVSLP